MRITCVEKANKDMEGLVPDEVGDLLIRYGLAVKVDDLPGDTEALAARWPARKP